MSTGLAHLGKQRFKALLRFNAVLASELWVRSFRACLITGPVNAIVPTPATSLDLSYYSPKTYAFKVSVTLTHPFSHLHCVCRAWLVTLRDRYLAFHT